MHPCVGVAERNIVSLLSHDLTVTAAQELTTLILAFPQSAQVLWQQDTCHVALNPTIKTTDHKCSSCLHVKRHGMSISRGRR